MKRKLFKFALLCASVFMLPMGAWAEDPTTISTLKVWNFNNETATGSGGITSVTEKDGLYLRATSGHKITGYVSLSKNTHFSDGYKVVATKVLELASTSGFAPQSTDAANSDCADRNDRCVAFKTGVAGKVYIAYREASGSADRTIKLFFDGTAVVTHTVKETPSAGGEIGKYSVAVMEYEASQGGTFFFGGYAKPQVMYIKFVPYGVVDTTIGDVVTATGTWDFSNFQSTAGNSDAVVNQDGLYYYKGSREMSVESQTLTSNLALGSKTYTSGTTLYGIKWNGNANVSGTGSYMASDIDMAAIAMNVGSAGTLYLALKQDGSGTTYNAYIDGTAYASILTKTGTGIEVYSLSFSEAGTLFLSGSGGKWGIYAARFEPTVATAKKRTLSIGSAGVMTFSSAYNQEIPDGVTAYIVSAVDGTENKATLKSISGTIPANTGVVLVGEEGSYTMTTAESASSVGDNLLVANVGDYKLPASVGSNYHYTLAAGPVFKHSSGSGALAAGKAFLRTTVNVEGGGSARSISLTFEGSDITGVNEVNVQKEDITNGEYYDLMGRRVVNPTKGLYILNGKKVFIK